MQINYFTARSGEWNERVVCPHHLYNIRGDAYLFAYDELRGEMRNFHLGRIESWHVLTETFERQSDFSVETWMASAFQVERSDTLYPIAIRFDEYQARYIRERKWHESQQPLEDLPDGGVIMRFESGGLDEVKRWVMQYGSHAEVLEPTALRADVAQEVERMKQMYGH